MAARLTGRTATILTIGALSTAIQGCESSNHNDATKKKTSVLLMRHCARSTGESGIYSNPSYTDFNNYSKTEWPNFGVPDMYCLDKGVSIIEQEGQWFKNTGQLPSPVFVIADDVERDHVTGQTLLKGLGLEVDSQTYSVDKGPFSSAAGSAGCPKLSVDEIKQSILSQLELYPQAPDFMTMMTKMYAMAGTGVAGDWVPTPCLLMDDFDSHWWAPLSGNCEVANNFAERFLMETAGGFQVGWGNMEPGDLPKFLEIHEWYMKVALNAPVVQKQKAASIAWAILDKLEAGAQGTTAFVGHDTNQGGLNSVLGLGWNPAPWPHNSTMPGSALRFDMEEGSDAVKMSYVFVDDFSKGGEMTSVPASIAGFPEGTITLKALRNLVESNTEQACRSDKPSVDEILEGEVTLTGFVI
mmetsp:Transcript_57768/g.122901  ORF Transcript_57768/g.122901 Transcript_57768/m.122901 type:complete len:412 (+) Transcript_57768:132-1367(+)|eukprot:CAMPEP_0206524172 /NCGR_PEP_ID=MMETSP0324_2-20121206/68038_1 /ASSEMBLY_ACC=CAM_ASM_000836 /TAXON_ID=2866 /ORGANISM="Crypthecodinium cohnii, Strain Seligo" /LENGTH=411 /DNA_ID=CAMNT_0054018713 /DNA_START=94 /DNA_END=1329 /DNA_ORIENTATION=+